MASSSPSAPPPTLSQRLWRRFCRRLTDVFYRHGEVAGLEHLPSSGPVILAANHVNALADAVVVQAAVPRPIHPVARSGLFKSPLLRPILSFIQAVPVYRRRGDGQAAAGSNDESFEKLFEYLGAGRVILIFPEGQSHSDPSLRPMKTGAARLALGHLERTGQALPVVPVGLTFTAKGRFRADVLVQLGSPVVFEPRSGEDGEAAIRRYTDEILDSLRQVTINVDSWRDLLLLRLLQHFFTLRSQRDERPTLAHRFRSFQSLIAAHRTLRDRFPSQVEILRLELERFEQLCRRWGVRDYQLELRYTPRVVLRFVARSLGFLLFVFPLTLWGFLNSALPYFATRQASRLSARGRDQYDTAGMLFGLFFFAFFWGVQTFFVAWHWGDLAAVLYAALLPITADIALKVGHERQRIFKEARVFLLFSRRQELQDYLRLKRQELEVKLAHMARLARQAREEPS